jgi:hypothetical protein
MGGTVVVVGATVVLVVVAWDAAVDVPSSAGAPAGQHDQQDHDDQARSGATDAGWHADAPSSAARGEGRVPRDML